MTSQSDMFLEGEGDNYFRRNKPTLDSVVTAYGNETSEVDWLCRALTPFQEQIHSVLEIGCANGAKLERMCSALGAKGAGIDPSALAVADGNQRLQDGKIRLHTGTASSLPFEPQSFDFCLLWVLPVPAGSPRFVPCHVRSRSSLEKWGLHRDH